MFVKSHQNKKPVEWDLRMKSHGLPLAVCFQTDQQALKYIL